MLIVVKVLEGVMDVETSLDYNFVSSIPMIASIPSIVDDKPKLYLLKPRVSYVN